jgi:hypothetical protein
MVFAKFLKTEQHQPCLGPPPVGDAATEAEAEALQGLVAVFVGMLAAALISSLNAKIVTLASLFRRETGLSLED